MCIVYLIHYIVVITTQTQGLHNTIHNGTIWNSQGESVTITTWDIFKVKDKDDLQIFKVILLKGKALPPDKMFFSKQNNLEDVKIFVFCFKDIPAGDSY